MKTGFIASNNEPSKVESRQQYADRFLRGELFEIVRHYDEKAMANPPVVQKTIDRIIEILVPEKPIDGDVVADAYYQGVEAAQKDVIEKIERIYSIVIKSPEFDEKTTRYFYGKLKEHFEKKI